MILTHHNADADAIASAIALSEFLKSKKIKVVIGVSESVSKPAKNIAKKFEIEIDPDCKRFENVIVVDGSSSDQFSTVKNLKVDLIIDHHIPGDLEKKAKFKLINPNERSTSQIIYNLLKRLNFEIDEKMSKILAAGILADTSYLRLARRKELKILLELLEISNKELCDIIKMIEIKSDTSERVACLKAAKRADIYKIGDLIVAVSMLTSHEAAAARSLIKIGADIAVVVTIKKKTEVRISSRARDEILKYGLDLSEIFKEVGNIIGGSGGGHDLAGSANGRDVNSVKKAIGFILRSISNKVGQRWKSLR